MTGRKRSGSRPQQDSNFKLKDRRLECPDSRTSFSPWWRHSPQLPWLRRHLSLEAEGKALNTELQGKTREQIAGDAAMVARLNAYDKKAGDFGKARQKAASEFQLTERQALIDFNKALEPVLLQVVSEKNAQIVLSKSALIYGVDSVDVSALVISKLDATTPTLSVVRKRIPDQPAQ